MSRSEFTSISWVRIVVIQQNFLFSWRLPNSSFGSYFIFNEMTYLSYISIRYGLTIHEEDADFATAPRNKKTQSSE